MSFTAVTCICMFQLKYDKSRIQDSPLHAYIYLLSIVQPQRLALLRRKWEVLK
jgi:hypothetical protein